MKCEPLRTPVLGTLGLQAGEDVRIIEGLLGGSPALPGVADAREKIAAAVTRLGQGPRK